VSDVYGMAALDERPTPEASWLSRRKSAWGASEMPMVLALTGRHPMHELPKYMQEKCAPFTTRKLHQRKWEGIPRLFLEKANIIRSEKAGPAARVGQDREQELLRAWVTLLVVGDYALEQEAEIDVATIRHASAVPREWFPLRSRLGRVAVTPDGFCRTESGELYDIEIKCTTSDVHDLRWTWLVQVQAQGMATGSSGAIVVAGPRWARDAARRDDGHPVRAFVPPDEELRAQIVAASDEAWLEVEKLNAEREGA
jgi:hypothetical protein